MPMSPSLLRPRRASGFNPKSIANLAMWYDASDMSRVTTVNGFVSEFRSSVGTYTVSQSIEANRPSTTTINGRQAISFDGSNDILRNDTAIAAPAGTFFVAFRVANAASGNIFNLGTSTPAQAFSGVAFTSSYPAASSRYGSTFRSARDLTSVITTNTTHVISSTIPNNATISAWLNGVAFSENTANSSSAFAGNTSGHSIGGRVNNSADANWFNGVFCEMLWYSSTLTASEVRAVERYLGARWGVTIP